MAGSAVAATAVAATAPSDISGDHTFRTVNNNRDNTFNQLLGINNSGKIAGYFGSGQKGHPNMGYVVSPQYGQGNFKNENFPGAAQTQVTGIDNNRDTVMRTASAPRRSTASTTGARWSGSIPTRPATPTGCWPRRATDRRPPTGPRPQRAG
jgi:hypothetical protein